MTVNHVVAGSIPALGVDKNRQDVIYCRHKRSIREIIMKFIVKSIFIAILAIIVLNWSAICAHI